MRFSRCASVSKGLRAPDFQQCPPRCIVNFTSSVSYTATDSATPHAYFNRGVAPGHVR